MLARLDARTWWLTAIMLACGFSVTRELWLLVPASMLLVLVSARFEGRPKRIPSWLIYAALAAAVVAIRVLFRVIFASNYLATGDEVLVQLPTLELHPLGSAITLLGPVTSSTLVAALTDGFRLAGIILAFGLANLAANPRRLLRFAPTALYELSTTASIALNLAPELIASFHRVRRARALRGDTSGVRAFPKLLVPVLEVTIDRSLGLGASMEARGFGRQGAMPKTVVTANRGIFALNLVLISLISYLILATDASFAWIAGLTVLVLAGFAVALRLSNGYRVRTNFTQTKLRGLDWIAICGVAVLVASAFIWGQS